MNAIRTQLAAIMDATVANRGNWHYALFRPCGANVTLYQAEHGVVYADCSAGYQIICRLAGAPNPLGQPNGYGNTGTCWAHLPHISMSEAQVGDAVLYGEGGSHHVAVVREPGADPLLWSNGRESAPELIRFSTERAWQPSPETWVRLMPPDPVPAPTPKVDPFWVWLRWRLGEGEFKGHGCDPAVRPNVPKLVPLSWWVRARKFIEARKKMRAG